MERIKVLHFPIANSKGGITQYVLRNWKFIDKSLFQFDFATMSNTLDFSHELEKDGCKIYYISCYAEDDKKKFIAEFKKILIEGNYDIVHLHTKQWKSFLVEQIARKIGVKKVIVHAHSTGIDTLEEQKRQEEELLHNHVLEHLTEDIATDFWACSWKAAEFIFGNRILSQKIKMMKNAIELSKYAYNPQIRGEYRKNLGIADNEWVIGNVGRFVYPKNQEFLINVFAEICNNDEVSSSRYRLLLVGSGEREKEYKRLVRENRIEKTVIFAGQRADVPQLLQAMDMFCLPSRFEGLPISLIEAQMSGLLCVASDSVTEEVNITGNVYYIPLEKEKWVENILRITKRTKERYDMYEEMAESGYDIETQIKVLEAGYLEGLL